ncbi:MAG: zinc-ribbon domain containing protein [Cyanobacteria bacterium P01_C01_bin.72]
MPDQKSYAHFVKHPRYGRQPRLTGLNPQTDFEGNVFLHWHSPQSCRIDNTAIAANLDQQVAATIPVTHYYDVERQCRDCARMFIFFAAEQKYWYEELKFPLESDCIRCFSCRAKQRHIARTLEQYESLFHIPDRTSEQTLMMIECCLYLIENNVFDFTSKQTQRIRTLLNTVPNEPKFKKRLKKIWQRFHKIQSG